jgi:hypothetical protein
MSGALIIVAVLLSAGAAPPRQPIRFSHKLHVKQAKCAACHTTVGKASAAGVPKLADCLDCHEGTQSKTPEGQKEEAKIEAFAKAKAEIPWKRVWRLPANVFFSHRIHVAVAKVECQTCHGKIETLDSPPSGPLKALTMTECIGCHEKSASPDGRDRKDGGPVKVVAGRQLSTDCNACHR